MTRINLLVLAVLTMSSLTVSAQSLNCSFLMKELKDGEWVEKFNNQFALEIDGKVYRYMGSSSNDSYEAKAKKISEGIEFTFDDYFLGTGHPKWFSIMFPGQKTIVLGKKTNDEKVTLTCNRK